MALLRPGRWGSRPQGGCLQHRTEAQRRPKGQDAGGTPALPGDPGRGGSFESETTDYCGLSGARTLSGEAGWRQTILFILSIHVNQGSTHARRRDQTPGTSFRDLGVTSWITLQLVSDKPGHRPPRRGGSFESETGFVSVERSGGKLLMTWSQFEGLHRDQQDA